MNPTRKTLRRLIAGSVGRKQAAVTFLLILVTAVAAYVKVSASQRATLLFAREASASAVTRLFADSCAAAVIFEDDAAIGSSLATLAHNDEVEYAAVWRLDPDGHVGRRLGELRRGPPIILGADPLATQIRREVDHVIATAAVREEKGPPVAVAAVSFSLKHEVRAIAQAQRTTLIYSSAAGLAVILLLMAMAKLVISGPLGKLVAAAKELERGGPGAVQIATVDEVGELARAFTSMASAIRIREQHINVRNRDMRLLLDNVGQGFLTLDLDGTVAEERSRVIDEWFGPVEGTLKMWDYLRRIDVRVAEYFEIGWAAVQEDILPLSLCLDQLPKRVVFRDLTFELAYRPIIESDRLAKTIVVITDVTVQVQSERSERAQREMASLFRRMRSDAQALHQFFVESGALVDAIVEWRGDPAARPAPGELAVMKRQIHTVKGNCGLFGAESVATYCHELEDIMDDSGTFPDQADRERLRALWNDIGEMRSQLMDGNSGAMRVEIDPDEHASFIEALRVAGDPHLLVARAESWRYEPAARRLSLLGEQLRGLAKRLGKGDLRVICEPTALRLPSGKWGPFWSVFSHLIRNTVDHGVETNDERVALNKTDTPTVVLSAARSGQEIVVAIEDDGRGIDWAKIAAAAAAHGLPHATREDLKAALLADAISSRSDRVTSTSGRGVGLSAVRDVVSRLGGRIEIESEPGRGACFRFWLPDSMLVEEDLEPPRRATGSQQITVAS
jgi:signal transduction histidine kinase